MFWDWAKRKAYALYRFCMKRRTEARKRRGLRCL